MLLNAVIDMNHYQSVASWQHVREAGILGVFHKATEGLGYVDPQYLDRIKPIRQKGGLMHGAYHFGTDADGVSQARHFINLIKTGLYDERTALMLDFEKNERDASQQMTVRGAEHFVAEVCRLTGRWPWLYTGDAFIMEHLTSRSDILANCKLWVAKYSKTPPEYPKHTWNKLSMWQYTGDGKGPEPRLVDGVLGYVDRNYFYGTQEELRELWGYPAKAA